MRANHRRNKTKPPPLISNTNYPGTAEVARKTLPRFGIEATPVDTTALDDVRAAIQPNTRMIHYAVSLGHHCSLVYLMETEDLIASSYRLEGRELEKYKKIAGEGLFRLSVGLEDTDDLIGDLKRILDQAR